jgi:hypothetical protein
MLLDIVFYSYQNIFLEKKIFICDKRRILFLPSKLIIPSLKAAYKRIRSLIKRKKQLLITPFVSSLGVT